MDIIELKTPYQRLKEEIDAGMRHTLQNGEPTCQET